MCHIQSLHPLRLTISIAMNQCKFCGNNTTNPKFCSRSCAAKETNKTPKRKISRICSRCDLYVKDHRTSLCKQHYQDRMNERAIRTKDLTIKDYIERDCVKKLHKSSTFAHIRGFNRYWNKEKTQLPCFVCGYDKHVELAHIQSISSFSTDTKLSEVNSSKNVVQLCPNCHWEFDNGLITLTFPDQ